MSEAWYTPETAARRLGLHPSTVYGLLATGQLRSYRVGPRRGRHRISEAHLAAYLASAESEPQAPPGRVASPLRPDGKPLRHIK